MNVLKTHKCFSGSVKFCDHESKSTKTKMNFSVFEPTGKIRGALIWLSGLTCTDENFMAKAGAQRELNEAGLAVICPDTSPRGLQLPAEHESYDFGSGASFYVDATTEGYKEHYRMYSYISDELYEMVRTMYKAPISIFGHSMGGHGALVIGLRNPDKFKSISAFSPIVNPSAGPWGQKALAGYLGSDQAAWAKYDACRLLEAGQKHPAMILIDQGAADPYLEKELLTHHFVSAGQKAKQQAEVRMQEGYDHSYYFISTFVRDHIQFHAKHLQ